MCRPSSFFDISVNFLIKCAEIAKFKALVDFIIHDALSVGIEYGGFG